ncbi:hypothetical protein HY636_06160 [Candidatus Woesearchaeota archaeon]|nr:hypothetical protein [Candidatus Woesearchaeota archaeon]
MKKENEKNRRFNINHKYNLLLVISITIIMALFLVSLNLASASTNIIDFPMVHAVLIGQTPDPAEPGNIVELRFNVWNNGSGILEDVNFELIPEWPLSFVHGQEAKIKVGDLKTKNTYSDKAEDTVVLLYYRLQADPKADSGTYQVKLEYSSKNKYSVVQKLPVYNIRVESSTSLLDIESFETQPEKIKSGDTGKLLLKLTNKGGVDLKDIKIKLDLTGPEFSPIGSTDEKLINELQRGYSTMAEYKLLASGDMKAKEYQIPVKIEFKDEKNNKYTKNNTITLLVDSSPGYLLNLEQTSVYNPNSKGKIVISLSNIGQSDLKYTGLELEDTDDYEVLGKNNEYLGNLESDDYETADYEIFVKDIPFGGLDKRNVPLKLKVYYKDSYNKEYTDEKEVVLPIYTASAAKKYGLVAGSSTKWIIILILIVILIVGYIVYKKRKNNNHK